MDLEKVRDLAISPFVATALITGPRMLALSVLNMVVEIESWICAK